MKRSEIVVAPLLFALGLAALGCSKKSEAAPTSGKRAGQKSLAFPVETTTVDAKPHELVISAPGTVDAFENIQVTARVAGVVDKVTFVEGQEVKLNAPLAYVDSRRYSLAVSAARAALEKSQAQAADSAANLKRRQDATVTNPGLIPGEEMATYQTAVQTAQADVDSSMEAVKLAQLNLDDSTVKAAAPGIIQTRTVVTGQYVNAGAVIATLLQRDPLLLHFDVATSEAPRLKVGMPVTFALKDSQTQYNAKITLVSGAADPETRLVPMTAEVQTDQHQFWLRPGSFAQVEIKLVSQKQYPMIPQTAARPSDRGFLAYIVQNGVAHERTLALGLHTDDGFVEVKSGLEPGDQLVTAGVEALSDGSKVRVGKVPSTTGGASGTAGSAAPAASESPEAAPSGSAGAPKHHRNAEAAGSAGAPAPIASGTAP
jgi:RND family efflux transporter MFP subunit